MIQKYQTLRLNISPHLVIMNLWVKYLLILYLNISYFRSKIHFEDDGTQNYSVLQSGCRYFKNVTNSDDI